MITQQWSLQAHSARTIPAHGLVHR
jgi:hypothetical protein